MTGIIEQRLIKENNLPSDFHFYKWECFPHGRSLHLYTEFTGAQAPLLTRGKRKGRPNWRKKFNDKTFVVTKEEIDRWSQEWVKETGQCLNCLGKGQEFEKWEAGIGATYRPCRKCNATGKAITA